MELTIKKDKETGATLHPPRFNTEAEGPEQAITFMLNNELERVLDEFFEDETDIFDLFVEVISGAGGLIIPMAVAVVGMGPLPGRLTPREDPALRDVAGGEGFHDLPMRKKSYGQETIWKLTREHFLGWKESRELEVIFSGVGRPALMRVTTARMLETAELLIEKGFDSFSRQVLIPGEEGQPPTLAPMEEILVAARTLWTSGIITGLQLGCEGSAVQDETIFRELLVALSQKD